MVNFILRESTCENGVLVYIGGLVRARLSAVAVEVLFSVNREASLDLLTGRVNKSKSRKCQLGGSLRGDKSGLHIQEVGVEETIRDVVICEINTVEAYIYREDIRLGVVGNNNLDLVFPQECCRGKSSCFSISESNSQLGAVVMRASEVFAIDNSLSTSNLYGAEMRLN